MFLKTLGVEFIQIVKKIIFCFFFCLGITGCLGLSQANVFPRRSVTSLAGNSNLANLAMAEAQPARALCLAGAATGLREERQATLQPTEQARLEVWIDAARSALGDAAATNAWAAGRAMTLDQAVAYALESLASDA